MDHPNLNHIHTFLLVLEHGSFSAAGEVLNLPASTISRRISQLEAELHLTLLDRTTRGIRPTREGQALRDGSILPVEALQNTLREVTALRENTQSSLCISVPPNHTQVIARLALDFHRQHPWIALKIVSSDRRMELSGREIDLVIRVSPSAATAGEPDLVVHPLIQYRHILCCSPSYLERFGEASHPDELPGLPCVGWGRYETTVSWEFEGAEENRTVVLSPGLVFNEYMAIQEVLCSGYGIGELPEIFCNQALEEGRLVQIMRKWRLPLKFLFVGVLKRKFTPRALSLFLDHCTRWKWYGGSLSSGK